MRVVACTFVLVVGVVAAPRCGSFKPADFGRLKLVADFQDNILRIVSGEVGTGYLIEPQLGYLLTAAHVIKASIEDPTLPIVVSHNNFGAATFKAHHLANMNDVALLQLDSPEPFTELPILDITFDLPNRADSVIVFGYGNEADDTSLTAQDGTVLTSQGEQDLTVRMSAFYGDSGAPAVDRQGRVVGTGVEYRPGSLVARFVPTAAIRNLLKLIPPTSRTLKIDGRLRAKGFTKEALAVQLRPNSTRLTNLEWYSWAIFVASQSTTQYETLREYFPCPIADAFRDRGLDYALDELKALQDESTRASALIGIGDKERQLGRWAASSKAYAEAVLMSQRVGSRDLQFNSLFGAGVTATDAGDVDAAETHFKGALDIARTLSNRDYQALDQMVIEHLLGSK